MAILPPGREHRVIACDPTIRATAEELRQFHSDLDIAMVEEQLERWFSEIRIGEVFEHNEPTMAVLFVGKLVGMTQIDVTLSALADSRSAELARLSRYAKRLLSP